MITYTSIKVCNYVKCPELQIHSFEIKIENEVITKKDSQEISNQHV